MKIKVSSVFIKQIINLLMICLPVILISKIAGNSYDNFTSKTDFFVILILFSIWTIAFCYAIKNKMTELIIIIFVSLFILYNLVKLFRVA